jgi:hypothetical protein
VPVLLIGCSVFVGRGFETLHTDETPTGKLTAKT